MLLLNIIRENKSILLQQRTFIFHFRKVYYIKIVNIPSISKKKSYLILIASSSIIIEIFSKFRYRVSMFLSPIIPKTILLRLTIKLITKNFDSIFVQP